ncbi:hypothetical protein Tco_0790409 [Tanacetum coccineum]
MDSFCCLCTGNRYLCVGGGCARICIDLMLYWRQKPRIVFRKVYASSPLLLCPKAVTRLLLKSETRFVRLRFTLLVEEDSGGVSSSSSRLMTSSHFLVEEDSGGVSSSSSRLMTSSYFLVLKKNWEEVIGWERGEQVRLEWELGDPKGQRCQQLAISQLAFVELFTCSSSTALLKLNNSLFAMAGVTCWLISEAGAIIILGVGKASDGETNGLKSASRLNIGPSWLALCQSGIERYGLCLLVLLMRMGDVPTLIIALKQ